MVSMNIFYYKNVVESNLLMDTQNSSLNGHNMICELKIKITNRFY